MFDIPEEIKPEGNKIPVVIVHGIWDNSETVRPLAEALEALGHPTHCISLTPNDASVSLRCYATQLRKFVQSELPEGKAFALIGFSMGGLVSAIYLQEEQGHKQASHFIAISAPLAGTILAYGALKVGAREMRPTSELVRSVRASQHLLTDLQLTTIRTPFDAMILPSSSSEILGAKNHLVPVAIHAWMLADGRVHELVAQALN
jgi:triacylglycerol lipase